MADEVKVEIVEDRHRPAGGDSLIQLAIERGLDTDKLEKLIELRNREIERQAKLEFDAAFSKMQREFGPVLRRNEAKNKQGKTMYTYAPLEDLQEAVGDIIAKHGFSYSWSEETIESGKRVFMTITGYGHARTNSFDVPVVDRTEIMNQIHVVGTMSSYGRRYTFIAGFGLTIKGEDPDGIFDKWADDFSAIDTASTMEELRVAYVDAYKRADGNLDAQRAIIRAKDARKKELENARD